MHAFGCYRQDDANAQFCGSTVDFLLRHPSSPVLVVRAGAPEPAARGTPLKFVCAIDGSHASYHAVKVAAEVCATEQSREQRNGQSVEI
jgi:hypothetical protein